MMESAESLLSPQICLRAEMALGGSPRSHFVEEIEAKSPRNLAQSQPLNFQTKPQIPFFRILSLCNTTHSKQCELFLPFRFGIASKKKLPS